MTSQLLSSHLLALLSAGPSTTTAKPSSGGNLSFLVLLVAVAAFYFLVIRPRAQRQRKARSAAATLEVGASAMSVGGIKGTIVGIDGDDVQMEVSPGVVLTFTRRAVNAQPAPADTPPLDEEGAGAAPGGATVADRADPADPAGPGAAPGEVPGDTGAQIPFGESSAHDPLAHGDEPGGGRAGSGTEDR